jgi:D-3-phosphoglycerate dehydrogenase
MKVLVHDPYITIAGKHAHKASFQDVLAGAGFLTCLAFAADETENLMNKAAFSALKQGSYLINISWRNFVDEATSEAVLNTGHLAGAALDVGQAPDQMPTPSLAAHPNVIATLHMGV